MSLGDPFIRILREIRAQGKLASFARNLIQVPLSAGTWRSAVPMSPYWTVTV